MPMLKPFPFVPAGVRVSTRPEGVPLETAVLVCEGRCATWTLHEAKPADPADDRARLAAGLPTIGAARFSCLDCGKPRRFGP